MDNDSILTLNNINRIIERVAKGQSELMIAQIMGLTPTEWNILKDDYRLQAALEKGNIAAIDTIDKAALDLAIGGIIELVETIEVWDEDIQDYRPQARKTKEVYNRPNLDMLRERKAYIIDKLQMNQMNQNKQIDNGELTQQDLLDKLKILTDKEAGHIVLLDKKGSK